MKEKVTVDIFEVMKYMEIDPKKAYQFLSRLQQLETTDPNSFTRQEEPGGVKVRVKSRKITKS